VFPQEPGTDADLKRRQRSGHDANRFLASGDEAGTAPEDRKFRPDVEGLRAVAVIVVVLFHVFTTAHSSLVSGGFIGVDVFFVISGFVITGLLLREAKDDKTIGLLNFYGRRARRIIPAMAFVIVVALVVDRALVSAAATNLLADDAKWSSVFLANFHLASEYPNFLVHRAESPLQNYWSLAVEEQFYVVYPILFLVLAIKFRVWSLHSKLTAFLGVTIVASFVWFVVTTTYVSLAYSPFGRAWELALGALVAVSAAKLKSLPPAIATTLSWAGLAGIIVAATCFSLTSRDPALVGGLPALSAALLIAGGTAAPSYGAEMLLRLPPFKWIGRWSYSYYLWHWPILVIAVQYWGPASVARNLYLAAFALVLSAATYFLVENPIRHAAFLTRSSTASVAVGALMIAVCFVLAVALAS
jgi:peptidoglycan/LPS O-acetylase OafA/YrhL